jgi:hypothetical protein
MIWPTGGTAAASSIRPNGFGRPRLRFRCVEERGVSYPYGEEEQCVQIEIYRAINALRQTHICDNNKL